MKYVLPIRTRSVLNLREHWRKRAERTKHERATAALLTPRGLRLPMAVTLTRIAPRPLDSDNLAASFKAVRDGIAAAVGVDDRDSPQLRWEYAQERGGPKEYAVRVEIT